MKKLKVYFGIVMFGLLLAGCQTVPMPKGPSSDSKNPLLPNAPLAAVNAIDTRTSKRIGSIQNKRYHFPTGQVSDIIPSVR